MSMINRIVSGFLVFAATQAQVPVKADPAPIDSCEHIAAIKTQVEVNKQVFLDQVKKLKTEADEDTDDCLALLQDYPKKRKGKESKEIRLACKNILKKVMELHKEGSAKVKDIIDEALLECKSYPRKNNADIIVHRICRRFSGIDLGKYVHDGWQEHSILRWLGVMEERKREKEEWENLRTDFNYYFKDFERDFEEMDEAIDDAIQSKRDFDPTVCPKIEIAPTSKGF